jgi:hypothetical protein
MVKVLRILSGAALLVVVAAGCGGAARPQRSASHGVPPALAQDWEGQASAIAAAASAGNSCRALQLANALRADVVASKDQLPSRLRPPLLTSVKRLAERIKCTPVVQAPPKKPIPPKKPKPPKEPHEHDHHGHHGHGGGGNDQ